MKVNSYWNFGWQGKQGHGGFISSLHGKCELFSSIEVTLWAGSDSSKIAATVTNQIFFDEICTFVSNNM